MDALLARLGVQAVNYAIRSGIALTSTYAVQQCSRLLKTVNDKAVHAKLKSLQKLLDSKIKILSPAIDLIEFKSSRGNVFLESAVPLAKSLHREIVRLGKRLDNAATAEEGSRSAGHSGARITEAHHAELLLIIADMQSLLERIDREIPLIQLAITASGEKMTTAMNPGISPSRLMQASTLLSFGDAQFATHYASDTGRPVVQVGPSFTLSLYMLFLGHSQTGVRSGQEDIVSSSTPERPGKPAPKEEPYGLGIGDKKPMWQEVMHKARVRLCRTPRGWALDRAQGFCPKDPRDVGLNGNAATTSAVMMLGRPDEYVYHLEIIEDLDDGRLHDDEETKAQPFDDMAMAGIRESIPIHQVSKIFYTNTGRILNIKNADGDNNPILLLKRDVNAQSPIKLREEWYADEESSDSQSQSGTGNTSPVSDDQAEIDRQLLEELESPGKSGHNGLRMKRFPAHLDPEWLALEVFVEDDDPDSSDTEDDDSTYGDRIEAGPTKPQTLDRPPEPRNRLSVDSNLAAQIRSISLGTDSPARTPAKTLFRLSPGNLAKKAQAESSDSWVARSPFGSIVTSLSLLEMLVRLTSLQEFQQTSHLSIPDHILTFFLEETSTTGLHGEERWEMRNEAKRRVGFDPYTDTPTKE
ncbi:RanGTP-binding protein-domain-containing protein [Bombardia bombarda]|uniref:RanGTP-binding protein-domain-containing protein n=1 Tax=Bombardia bombarda TaxID=252184 RepID=A0AA40C8V8_9PEZI|nr:RanGTP-binding protein-domain-containing protein [Bombardia bombarda]